MDDCATVWGIYSWQPVGKPKVTARKEDLFIPPVAVTQQKVTPSIRHDSARGNFVRDEEVEETLLKLLQLFSEFLIDHDAVFVPEEEARETRLLEQNLLRLRPMRAETHTVKMKKANESKPEGDHNVLTHFPTYPNREVCWMVKTTRARCKH